MSIFLNYEGIKGESSDSNHKDWVDITGWTFDIERAITSATSTRGDRESSNAEIGDLLLTKHTDSSTPKFFIESCCGTGKNATLHFTKSGAGSGADVYMEIILKNALISKFSIAGNDKDVNRPQEAISISFVEIEVKYIQHDEDGNAMAPVAVGFDTATNAKK